MRNWKAFIFLIPFLASCGDKTPSCDDAIAIGKLQERLRENLGYSIGADVWKSVSDSVSIKVDNIRTKEKNDQVKSAVCVATFNVSLDQNSVEQYISSVDHRLLIDPYWSHLFKQNVSKLKAGFSDSIKYSIEVLNSSKELYVELLREY